VNLPQVVAAAEWQVARDELLVKEKALTRASDALNAERRRLPMVAFPKEYEFEGRDGKANLLDLFEGRRQLIVYHFMLAPGSDRGCPGCSFLVDNLGHPAHLNARDTTFVLVAPARLSEIEAFRTRMGWDVPWVSAFDSDFSADCGIDGGFGVSVFIRDGDDIFRSYFTSGRGGDQFLGTLRYLDLTPLGRQEAWEESSRGNDEAGAWWRLHDEYDA